MDVYPGLETLTAPIQLCFILPAVLSLPVGPLRVSFSLGDSFLEISSHDNPSVLPYSCVQLWAGFSGQIGEEDTVLRARYL